MEQTREKTVMTNVEIWATSIGFSSPIRVQLAALSDKSDTMEACRRSHLPVVQTICHIMSSQILAKEGRPRNAHNISLRK